MFDLLELDGSVLLAIMVLLPIVLLVLWVLFLMSRGIWRLWRPQVRQSFHLIEEGDTKRIRLAPPSGLLAFAAMLALLCFPTAFGLLCCLQAPPSTLTMSLAWIFVLGVSAAVCVRIVYGTPAGNYDLVINANKRTLTISSALLWTGACVILFDDILAIFVKSVVDKETQNVTYRAVICWQQDGKPREFEIYHLETANQAEAKELADYLLSQCQPENAA
ncbi:MAG TPA: hypothetical protein VFE62_30270 [Gemmataceae bacterium]|nr:hypothetical protein [Gemmataceae bacterium]